MQALSEVFDVLIPPGDCSDAVGEALSAIDSVHSVPEGLPHVPIYPMGSRTLLGGYAYRGDAPLGLVISLQDDDPAFTAIHEVGHYLDHQALGSGPPRFASAEGELDAVLDVIRATEAVAELVRLEASAPIAYAGRGGVTVIFDQSDFTYRLELEELFARAYAQYVAVRSGDAGLRRGLVAAQGIVYPEQWKDQDFEAVTAAFDDLWEALGWSGS